MSYQVLALRWRPQVFDDLVGQETVTRTLKNAIEQGRIAHAFLFSGVRGVGKTSAARILAKALNCSNADEPTVHPCGECASCKEIAASRSLDVLEIDGASHTKVDEIREVLDSSQYAPSRDRYKVYVIDEVHMLSIHSFNALLKTLEEPPPHLKFIFATTEYHKIPDTIVSRCQSFEFRTVSSKDIAARLRHIAEVDQIDISDGALSQIARAAEGSMRDGLSAMDQVVAATSSRIEESDVADLLGLIAGDVLSRAARAIIDRDTAEILKVVDQLVTGGRDLQSFARGLMQLFRDILVIRVAPDSPELVEIAGERDALVELSQRVTDEDLIRGLDVLTRLEGSLRWSPEPRFHLEAGLLKIAALRRLASFEELIARFESLASSPTPKSPGTGGPTTAGRPGSSSSNKPGRAARRRESNRGQEVSAQIAPGGEKPPLQAEEQGTAATSPQAIVERVLERLRSAKPKLAALFSHHNGAQMEGDCLRLGFEAVPVFLREQIQQEEVRELLEKEASDAAGRKLRVEVIFSDVEEPAEKSEPKSTNETDGELYERAVRDPMVRGFVETFKGEIETVRPRESHAGPETDRTAKS
jgi:DNA polymerase-3 subunit gamma/tau